MVGESSSSNDYNDDGSQPSSSALCQKTLTPPSPTSTPFPSSTPLMTLPSSDDTSNSLPLSAESIESAEATGLTSTSEAQSPALTGKDASHPRGFRSLSGSPKELWCTFAVKFLESLAYFSLSIILTLFLTREFGYSDVKSGTIYGAYGALITFYGIFTGLLLDRIGVVKSLQIGLSIALLARTLLLLTTATSVGHVLLWAILLVVLPIANSLVNPVTVVAVRRYTDSKNRGFAYGIFYVMMNAGALLSGFIVDAFRKVLNGDGDHENKDENEAEDPSEDSGSDESSGSGTQYEMTVFSWTPYRAVIMVGVAATIFALITAAYMNEIKVEVDEEGNAIKDETENPSEASMKDQPGVKTKSHGLKTKAFVPTKTPPITSLKETLKGASFWRFVLVGIITTNIRMVFRHLDATLPKFMLREFGPDAPFGLVYAINPAAVIILTPIVSAFTSEIPAIIMILVGITIGAASLIFMVFWSDTLWACFAFTLLFSVGETAWSPRLYDYAINSAKEGQEGIFSAFAFAPLFLAQLPVGFLSGYLLDTFCPSEDYCDGQSLWGVVAGLAAMSPVSMVVLWPCLNVKNNVSGDSNNTILSESNSLDDRTSSELSEPLLTEPST